MSFLNKLKKKVTAEKQQPVKEQKTPSSNASKKSSTKKSSKRKDEKYIKKVAEGAGWTYEKAKEEMEIAKTQLGVSFALYSNKEFYKYTRPRQERLAGMYERKRKRKEARLAAMCKETGLTREELLNRIRHYQKLNITKVTNTEFAKYGMHLMNDEEVRSLLSDIADLRERTPLLREKLHQIDKGELTYDDVQQDYAEYLEAVKKTLTPALRTSLTKKISRLLPDLKDDKDSLDNVLLDMEMCVQLLQFNLEEYSMYHLYLASFPEKREYVNDRVRIDMLSQYNSMELRDIINNKLQTYQTLGQFFRRDVAYIKDMSDLELFSAFIKKHPTFVCKPISESMGRGVELLHFDPESDLEAALKKTLEEKRTFLMEERITSHPEMAKFNEDSLNTVRLMAFYDGETAKPITGFMRTGRPGSFVDNAGAGGIYASVDVTTGILNSDGGDEAGHVYKEHPEAHLTYKGFQIPHWDKAVQVACDACKTLGGTNFIGWDLALTDQNEWVIVEGNSFPQWVHQGPLFRGLRQMLIESVGYKFE